jgi:hypothetical protein
MLTLIIFALLLSQRMPGVSLILLAYAFAALAIMLVLFGKRGFVEFSRACPWGWFLGSEILVFVWPFILYWFYFGHRSDD